MDPGSFGFEVRQLPGAPDAAIVVVKGALDAKSVIGFKTKIDELFTGGIRQLVLDLADVKYINSTGLAYLINLSESLKERQGAAWLAAVQPKVKIILETMGVVEFFRLSRTPQEAIAELGKREKRPKVEEVKRGSAGKAAPPAPVAAVLPDRPAITHRPSAASTERKTGRLSPPSETPQPSPVGNRFMRFLRRLFGRR
jgi:anti-anti-sigma factor